MSEGNKVFVPVAQANRAERVGSCFLNINDSAQIFLDRTFSEMRELGLVLAPHWDIDHLCYRVESQSQYLEFKDFFSTQGRLLIESQVNGRLISTFELFAPICFEGYQINLIELPAPRPGKAFNLGFEHFEVVCDLPFSEVIAQSPDLSWDTSGLKKVFNPELEVKLPSGSVKFHHLSLLSVINLEKNEKVWSALQGSKILFELKEFFPLVTGTFPLALGTEDSDLDLTICCKDFKSLGSRLESLYGSLQEFSLEQVEIDSLDTLICSFFFGGVRFEIFAQGIASVKQKSFIHFAVEEKILKFGGETLRKQVQMERLKGLKTEPAFAKVLGLKGDPYTELLHWQTKPVKFLRRLIEGGT